MSYSISRKSLVLVMLILLVGTSVMPHIKGDIRKSGCEEKGQKITNNLIQMSRQIPGYSRDVDWWPMFHNDLKNTGYSASDAPDTNNVKWSYDLVDSVASPVVINGKVYVGTNDKKVYCLDANTGTQIWSYSTDDGVYLSSPAISDGKVYINEADEVLCLDADTGSQIWSCNSGGGWSSPAISDGKVYVGSNDNNVYCLDADSGSQIWSYTTGGQVKSSPAVVNGKVYVGSNDNNVYCLDADSGSYIWSYTTGGPVDSSPAVANGKVYVGSYDYNVYCLDADSGSQIWSYSPLCVHISSPAVAYGKVYIGGYCSSEVLCLDADAGTKIWSYVTNNLIWSSPAVADGKVYVGSNDEKVYCLFAETGSQIWSYTTGNAIITSPAIADEKVYVGSMDGKIYCFGNGNQQPFSNFYWTPLYPESGEIVTFDASDSFDPDGSIVLYEWDWDNDGVYDETYTTPTATHIWNEEDSYPVTLKVTDDDGANDIRTKIVYVGNQPPVAEFTWTPMHPESSELVTFDASDSFDPDGSIVLYEWDWDNDGIFDESNLIPIATHSWLQPGSYPVVLKVSDDDSAEGISVKIVYISVMPPVADFTWTPTSPISGEMVTFDASDSFDPDGSIVLYEWDWDGDGVFDESNTTHIAFHSWFQPGSYFVALRVTDNDGANNTETKVVNVLNRPPVANFDWIPTNPISSEMVTFDASDSFDPDGSIVLYEWDWDNDGEYDESHTIPTAIKTWAEGGNYSVTLRIKDNDDGMDIETKIVYVIADEPPNTPEISGSTNGKAGEEYDYTFITTDPDGDNVSYWIDWGDDDNTGWIGPYSSDEEVTLSHTWSEQGTYTIKAKAKDIYDAESNWAELGVSMPKDRAINTPFKWFLQNHPNLFPVLRYLLGL